MEYKKKLEKTEYIVEAIKLENTDNCQEALKHFNICPEDLYIDDNKIGVFVTNNQGYKTLLYSINKDVYLVKDTNKHSRSWLNYFYLINSDIFNILFEQISDTGE